MLSKTGGAGLSAAAEVMIKYSFQYDRNTEVLKANYEDGSAFEFFDIPPSLYDEMRRAPSEAKFFNAHIWPKFEHTSRYDSLDAFFHYFAANIIGFEEPVTAHSRRSGDEDTPLHVVCRWGDVSALDLLLRAGADVDAKDEMGMTPLHVAASSGHVRCAERLLVVGATADEKSESGFTPRDGALRSGNARMIALFEPALRTRDVVQES